MNIDISEKDLDLLIEVVETAIDLRQNIPSHLIKLKRKLVAKKKDIKKAIER